MKVFATFLEGTQLHARLGLKRMEVSFPGLTLKELLKYLIDSLGPAARLDLADPWLQIIINGRPEAHPVDPNKPLKEGDALHFLIALDGG